MCKIHLSIAKIKKALKNDDDGKYTIHTLMFVWVYFYSYNTS